MRAAALCRLATSAFIAAGLIGPASAQSAAGAPATVGQGSFDEFFQSDGPEAPSQGGSRRRAGRGGDGTSYRQSIVPSYDDDPDNYEPAIVVADDHLDHSGCFPARRRGRFTARYDIVAAGPIYYSSWAAGCAARHAGFDPRSGTYAGPDGIRLRCD